MLGGTAGSGDIGPGQRCGRGDDTSGHACTGEPFRVCVAQCIEQSHPDEHDCCGVFFLLVLRVSESASDQSADVNIP